MKVEECQWNVWEAGNEKGEKRRREKRGNEAKELENEKKIRWNE